MMLAVVVEEGTLGGGYQWGWRSVGQSRVVGREIRDRNQRRRSRWDRDLAEHRGDLGI
jgi:hypothetical protein